MALPPSSGFPHPNSPLVDSGGNFTFNWYNYFSQSAAQTVTNNSLPPGIEDYLTGLPTTPSDNSLHLLVGPGGEYAEEDGTVTSSSSPFLILAAPRSRTAWISKFLSYGDWHCGHEQVRYARSAEDVQAWFSMKNIGTVETAVAPFWRSLEKLNPRPRIITVRRKPEDSLRSLLATGLFDPLATKKLIFSINAKLDQIEKRVEGVVRIEFDELASDPSRLWCAALPLPFDEAWYAALSSINIQFSLPLLLRYFHANRQSLAKFAAAVRQRTIIDLAIKYPKELPACSIGLEPFDLALSDAAGAAAEHSLAVGEAPDSFREKNLPLLRELEAKGNLLTTVARSNGRVFGYLVTVLSPSLESSSLLGVHTLFFASSLFPGLGLRLQRFASAAAKQRGVSELWWKEGKGARIGVLARRQGAVPAGQMFKAEV